MTIFVKCEAYEKLRKYESNENNRSKSHIPKSVYLAANKILQIKKIRNDFTLITDLPQGTTNMANKVHLITTKATICHGILGLNFNIN